MWIRQTKGKIAFFTKLLQNRSHTENNLISTKNIHKNACLCGRFWESNPKADYLDEKFHDQMDKEQKEKWYGIKDGLKDLRREIGKWKNEMHDHFTNEGKNFVLPGDIDYVWKFDDAQKLKAWSTLCDSDHNEGFSRCSFEMSPTGKSLFHGFLNTQAPKDGRVKTAGYCGIKSRRVMKSFGRDGYMDWEQFTHLIMRVRGDGRTYMINISTAGYFDITWNDVYHYVLHTRGGPYWQDVKIPFSKFVFGSKGRFQDKQGRIDLDRIASFGIAAGKVDGPFYLEIDYVGVECDLSEQEEFAYEMYKLPNYVAGV